VLGASMRYSTIRLGIVGLGQSRGGEDRRGEDRYDRREERSGSVLNSILPPKETRRHKKK
jgi:hypothetical protein